MRWQTAFSGRWATCQEGQNGARSGAASKWSGTGVGGLPKEGLLHLSLQEESLAGRTQRVFERELKKRRVIRSRGERGPGSEEPWDSWPSGVGQALSLSWSDPFGQLPLSSVTIAEGPGAQRQVWGWTPPLVVPSLLAPQGLRALQHQEWPVARAQPSQHRLLKAMTATCQAHPHGHGGPTAQGAWKPFAFCNFH